MCLQPFLHIESSADKIFSIESTQFTTPERGLLHISVQTSPQHYINLPFSVNTHIAQPKQLYITLQCHKQPVWESVSAARLLHNMLCRSQECDPTGQATYKTYLLWAEHTCRHKLRLPHTDAHSQINPCVTRHLFREARIPVSTGCNRISIPFIFMCIDLMSFFLSFFKLKRWISFEIIIIHQANLVWCNLLNPKSFRINGPGLDDVAVFLYCRSDSPNHFV